MTRIGGELCAVLQRRGEFNPETDERESWANACQMTVHGGVEEGETINEALLRETTEEMGVFLKWKVLELDSKGCLRELQKLEEKERLTITFGMLLESSPLKNLRLQPGSGGIRIIKASQLDSVEDVRTYPKNFGVWDNRVTAMFPDDFKALKRAFEIFNAS